MNAKSRRPCTASLARLCSPARGEVEFFLGARLSTGALMSYIVLALTLSLFFASAPAASAQPNLSDDVDTLIIEARRFMAAGNMERALAAMRKAVRLRPRDPTLHATLAEIHMGADDNANARLAVDEAIKLDSNYAPARQVLGALLRRAGDFEGAIREAKLALSLKPDPEFTMRAHLTLGFTYKQLKRYPEAADEFRVAARLVPTYGYPQSQLGDALFLLGKYDEALAAYRRAIEVDPYDGLARLNLGAALENQGRAEEAGQYYRELLQLYPTETNKVEVEKRLSRLQAAGLPGGAGAGAASRAGVSLAEGDYAKFSDKDYQHLLLWDAVDGGRADLVKLLLAHGIRDEKGHAAATAYRKGLTEIEELLERAAPQPRSPATLNILLLASTEKGDVARARALLAAGADQKDEALSSAARQEKEALEMVRLLLDRGANAGYLNPNYAQGMEAATPLMYAAGKGHVETVKLLLARGAEVDGRTKGGTALMRAVRFGRGEIVRLLLAAGADVNARDAGENSVLMLAAPATYRVGEWPDERVEVDPARIETLRLLLGRGADVNAKNHEGETPLMRADLAEVVKLLAARGADVNAKNQRGQTAFLLRVQDDFKVAEALVGSGADVNEKDGWGDTALISALYDHSNPQMTPEYVQAKVERLLSLAKNIDVNAQNEKGETALMRAVRLGNIEVIRLLLSRGARVNASDALGETAFVLAYKKNDPGLEKLLGSSAPEQLTPAILNAYLVAAIVKKDAAKVKEVLDKGANPNHEFSLGLDLMGTTNSVLVLAAGVGHAGIVQMLLDKGADPNAVGLLGGSESGLNHGTALQAARDPEVIEILKRAVIKKKQ